MTSSFEKDPYPGKPKILFVGLAESTHTHAWIDLLLDAELNVRLFALPSGCPPDEWWVRTYVSSLCKQRRSETRKYLYRGLIGSIHYYLSRLYDMRYSSKFSAFKTVTWLWEKWSGFINQFGQCVGNSDICVTIEAWLANIIKQWEPDIIQTLGLFDDQGGMFYYKVRQAYHLEGYGKWIIQLRGGSDLTLRRHDPEFKEEIRQVLMDCHQILSDNRANIHYANDLGVPEEKFAPIVPVPGTGGIDVNHLALTSSIKPSKRERIILWPKAYESPWSKAAPVLEAIQQAWVNISPCEFHITAMTPEVRMWFWSLPEEIRKHCKVYERVPRNLVLDLMKRARVLLAPSLIDGVPNILYEAMACGAFPIVSPLETITNLIKQDENVLFARNLYPNEIADALIRAMMDDELVDQAAHKNLRLVREIADRKSIRKKVIDYYQNLMKQ